MPEVQPDPNKPLRVVGRYALYGKLATGGMATVHFGRLLGPVGFSRTVAIKRLHPQFAKDPEFVAMFLDEARLAARIQHPNVVATLDVVSMSDELFLVMDYVRGESFSRLLRMVNKQDLLLPEGFVASVVSGMLHGLHAAHEATDERGQPLRVVHRDVSPQNVLVGVDGVPRVLDFGVAKAAARMQVTREGQMKGKLSYMSPEQLQGRRVDRRSDIFASGVVLWEALTGERLFTGDDASEVLTKIITQPVSPPSRINPRVRPEIDHLVLRALEKDPDARYATSREFAIAVEQTMQLCSPREVGEWVEGIAGDSLEQREQALAEIESISAVGHLSAFNDSDPQMLRTLVESYSGRHSVATVPDVVAPALVDDVATQLYQPGSRPEWPSLDDLTQVSEDQEEITKPGRQRDPDDPFAAQREKNKRVLFIAAGGLLLLLFGVLVSSLVGSSGEAESSEPKETNASESPTSSPEPPEATAEPAAADTASTAFDPAELPTAEAPPAKPRAPSQPSAPSKPKVGIPSSKPKTSQEGKAGKCAQPWFIDDRGIRRIKPECL